MNTTRVPAWERRAAARQAELDARPADTTTGPGPRSDWPAIVLGAISVLVVLAVIWPVSFALCSSGVTCPDTTNLPVAVRSSTAPGGA